MQRSLFCFTWMGDRGHFREQCFQRQRRGDAGNHDQKDDRRKINRLDNADLKALLGHDQGDLTAGHHADTDFKRVSPVETTGSGRQSTADDFCQQRNEKQTLNSRISGVSPLMSVFKPMLTKKIGAKIT